MWIGFMKPKKVVQPPSFRKDARIANAKTIIVYANLYWRSRGVIFMDNSIDERLTHCSLREWIMLNAMRSIVGNHSAQVHPVEQIEHFVDLFDDGTPDLILIDNLRTLEKADFYKTTWINNVWIGIEEQHCCVYKMSILNEPEPPKQVFNALTFNICGNSILPPRLAHKKVESFLAQVLGFNS